MEKLTELIATRKVNYSEDLAVILVSLKKVELKKIVDAHGLKGCSSLNKSELIERISETLCEVNRLKNLLNTIKKESLNALKALSNSSYAALESTDPVDIENLVELGYIYPVLNQADLVFMMPKAVKEIYKSIESPLDQNKTTTSRTVRSATGKQMPIRVNKVGRNAPCPCNSGKKYKKCCGF